jgi:hypothetical protein
MAVPYTFGTAISSIPLSQLDINFSTPITLGNTSIQLGSNYSTLNNVTIGNCTVDGSNTVGYLSIPQNSQNASYNVLLSDTGRQLFHSVGQIAATYTIPANSNVAFVTGAAITFVNLSANAVTISITTDTMYLSGVGTTGNRTLNQYGIATAVKITSTSWLISGSGLT